MRWLNVIAVAAASVAIPMAAGAQGTLSTQGFGYPPGQLSARALATGGGLAEFDTDTPLNPAAIALTGDPRLYLQYEPEFRKLSNGNLTSATTTSRFPVISALVPAGSHVTLGASVSTFLDRSSSTKTVRTLDVAGVAATFTETNRILGAINDVRLAVGWTPSAKFQLGLGGHVYTGQNKDFFSQTFPDTLKFSSVSQVSTVSYTGYGVSGGVIFRPSRVLGIALSGRKGATISSHAGDTLLSRANVPDRVAAGISYEGIPGSSISAHLAHDQWSTLNSLSASGLAATNAWDGGLGVEAIGPRIAERQTILRLGARYRTLPFEASGGKVKELSFAGGFGTQFLRDRAAFDLTLERSMRSADASALSAVRERAFTLSFGLRVRP